MTDEERLAAFEACWKKYDDEKRRQGLSFITNLLRANWLGAGTDWGAMVLDSLDRPNECLSILSPEQIAKARAQATQAFRLWQAEQRMNKNI